MRPFLAYLIIAFICYSCTSKKKNDSSPLKVIPENASLIFQINDFESVKNEFSSNEILNGLTLNKPFSTLKNSLKDLGLLSNQKNGLVALSVDSLNIDYTFITKDSLSIDNWAELTSKSKEDLTFNAYTVTKYTVIYGETIFCYKGVIYI